jgi:hypothetical protein
MGSSSDRSSEETVLQTQQRRGQKRIHDTKFKCITAIVNCNAKENNHFEKPSFSSNPGIN